MQCPLCQASKPTLFYQQDSVSSYICSHCDLLFKDKYLAPAEEQARYEKHNNDLEDPRYLNYLDQLWSLRPDDVEFKTVLDFGCGPTRGLEKLAKEYCVDSYDSYFYPLELKKYDLVFCCEVVEHFNRPKVSWKTLSSVTKNILLLRTELYTQAEYKNWYYKDDPTHVCFYSYKTLELMEEWFGLKLLDSKDDNKFIFKKL